MERCQAWKTLLLTNRSCCGTRPIPSLSLLSLSLFLNFHTDWELLLLGEIATQEPDVNQILVGTQTLHVQLFHCFTLVFMHKTERLQQPFQLVC